MLRLRLIASETIKPETTEHMSTTSPDEHIPPPTETSTVPPRADAAADAVEEAARIPVTPTVDDEPEELALPPERRAQLEAYGVHDLTLYTRAYAAAGDGVRLMRDWVSKGKHVTGILHYPELSFAESGLPHVSYSLGFDSATPRDYGWTFRELDVSALPSWQAWSAAVEADARAREFFGLTADTSRDRHSRIVETSVRLAIEEFVERYLHVTSEQPPVSSDAAGHTLDDGIFAPIYVEWERAVFAPELYFDIVIPIIRQRFDVDVLELDGQASIERMSEDLQLARFDARKHARADIDSASAPATHALVLKSWKVANEGTWWQRITTLTNEDGFSAAMPFIDAFFAALRLVTGHGVGYGHVVIRHDGWATGWTARLPAVTVWTQRRYADAVGEGRVWDPPPVLDRAQAEEVGRYYRALATTQSAALRLAMRRLNTAFQRSGEEDAILDITMGLEALLTNDSTQEITYRLSMRMAALTAIVPHPEYQPEIVARLCKRVYDFRSAVIHGSAAKLETKRVIRLETEDAVPVVEIGLSLLRHAVRALCLHPAYLDAGALDRWMLRVGADPTVVAP